MLQDHKAQLIILMENFALTLTLKQYVLWKCIQNVYQNLKPSYFTIINFLFISLIHIGLFQRKKREWSMKQSKNVWDLEECKKKS